MPSQKWVIVAGFCSRCGRQTDRLYPAFRQQVCRECLNARPRKGQGSSGLGANGQASFVLTETQGLWLKRVPKSDGQFGLLYRTHYPEAKGIPGRSLCYLLYDGERLMGILAGNSPPHHYLKFVEFFGGAAETHYLRNCAFRLVEQQKNLATRALRLFRETVKKDYEAKFQDELLGLVTFVEPPRTGAVYKADNWTYLGQTEGVQVRRDEWDKTFTPGGTVKLIFVYKYPKRGGAR